MPSCKNSQDSLVRNGTQSKTHSKKTESIHLKNISRKKIPLNYQLSINRSPVPQIDKNSKLSSSVNPFNVIVISRERNNGKIHQS